MPHDHAQAVLPPAAAQHTGAAAVARLWPRLALIAPPFVLGLALLSAIGSGLQREAYFGADDLYAPTLVADLLSWSGSLRDWRLTPAPYLFPDLTVYLAAHVLRLNVETAQYLSALVQLWAFVWLADRLARQLTRARELFSACVTVSLTALLLLRIANVVDVPALVTLYRPTNHGGAAITTLLVLWLCLRSARFTRGWALALAAISCIAGVSDPLFGVSCAAPLLALGLLACVPRAWHGLIERADPQRPGLRNRLLLAGMGGLSGAALTGRLHALLNELRGIKLADSREQAWRALWHDLSDGPSGKWLACVVVLCLITLARRSRGSGKLRALALWQVGSVVTTIAGIVWSKNYIDPGSLRYLTVPFALAPVSAAVIAAQWISSRTDTLQAQRIVGASAALMVVASCAGAVIAAPLLVRGEYASSWRADASCVDAVLQREGIDTILTDYWRCKPLRVFSHGKVHALQMRAKLKRPYFWIASRGWYRGEHQLGVIMTNELRPDAIIRNYGEPAQVDHCGDMELFSYRGRARDKLNLNMNRMFKAFVEEPSPP